MAQAHNMVTDTITAKITELEQEQIQLQRSVERLAEVSSDLAALRKTLAVLSGRRSSSAISQNGGPAVQIVMPLGARPITPGSVGAFVIDVLKEAGKPLHVKELLPKVQAKGKPKLSMGTLVSTVAGYAKTGKLKRTMPNTYTLLQG